MKKAVRAQARYITEIKRYTALKEKSGKNELLRNWARRLARQGKKVTFQVMFALAYTKLCKNLAFNPPFRQIVNANDNG